MAPRLGTLLKAPAKIAITASTIQVYEFLIFPAPVRALVGSIENSPFNTATKSAPIEGPVGRFFGGACDMSFGIG